VGFYDDADGNPHSFLLSGGQYTTLPEPPNGSIPGFTFANGINDRGQIVGSYDDANFVDHGFLLSGGQYTTIDPPNTTSFGFSQPNGINASGQIVGFYTDAKNLFHNYLLSGGQYTIDLKVFNSITALAGINDHGQIVGKYGDANHIIHGFLLSGGQATTIDNPNAGTGRFSQGTNPTAINDRGQIVGYYTDTNGAFHGFLADPVPGNSAAADPSSPNSVTALSPAAATPSVVLVTVPLTQLTPTPPPPINAPADPGVPVGIGLGGPFTGATTAVPMAPGTTLVGQSASGADGGSHADAGITGNSLFVSNLDDPFAKEAM
jgi:probable HAF family extracellular repeat protein